MFTDIKKLQAFVAIVEEGSMSRAAERLGVAQPWMSMQLSRLEDIVDGELLERSKGKLLKLTELGETFLPMAKRLLEQCDGMHQEMRALRDRNRRLVLGVDPVTLYMPERNALIRKFISQCPDIELRIIDQTPRQLYAGLKNGTFDIILGPELGADENCELLPLYRYEIYLLVPKSVIGEHDAADHSTVSDLKVLGVSTDYYTSAMTAWAKSALGLSKANWVSCPETGYLALIRYAAMMGVATLSPDFSASIPEIRRDFELRSIGPRPSVTMQWSLVRRSGPLRRVPQKFWNLAARLSGAAEPAAPQASRRG